ncbi:MAG TPA: PKD domain-containing protein [Ohtaekwangia sp.]|nr:PKD domain-containing protein [Ohtaekwangia sp.]
MKLKSILFAFLALAVIACEDDEIGRSKAQAEFTFTVDDEDKQQLSFSNQSEGASFYQWNFGDNTSSLEENPTHRYLTGGTYIVTLMAKSKEGSKVITKQVVVEGNAVNLITGGDMSDPDAWNIYSAGTTLTTAEFTNGVLKFSNGTGTAQTNVIVWQSVEVEADKTYKFSAQVSGSGATQSWMEVFITPETPTDGSDYGNGAYMYTGLNTWAGCGTSAFAGDLATLGCNDGAGTGQNGSVTFDESGTINLIIKVGSWDGNLGTSGITLDDVKLEELD